MPRCWDVGMEGCWGAQMGATGMEGCQDAGCWDVGMWGCRVAGVWGWRGAGVQHIGTPGCREMEIRGDADTLGCKDTGMQGHSCRPARSRAGTAGALHLQRSPQHTGEAGDGEGGRAVGRLLTQAQLTQQLPHHRRQLEPVACGEERVAGGGTATPMGPASSGVLGRREGWVPSPTREAGPDDDVAELGVLVQDEVFIWGVLGEPWCEGVGSGVLSRTRG